MKPSDHEQSSGNIFADKVLRGRMESVTIDILAAWLNALGRTVEIRVHPYVGGMPTGELAMAP